MKSFAAVILLSLCLSLTTLAGGGDWDVPQQTALPHSQVVVIPDKDSGGNLGLWVAIIGAVATLGAAAITVRTNRKN